MGKRARMGLGIACVGAAILYSRFAGGPGEAAASTGAHARPRSVHHAPALASHTDELAVVMAGDDGGRPAGGFCVPIVTRTADGSADPDVAIVVSDFDTGEVLLEGRTDAEGAFDACLPPVGTALVDAWDDEGRWARGTVSQGDPDFDEPIARMILRLIETPTVIGTVVDESGRPIAGAEVQLTVFEPDYDGRPLDLGTSYTRELTDQRELHTDAYGRFEMRIGEAGLFAVFVRASGYREAIEGPVVARPGARDEVRLVLQRGAEIAGRALVEGQPLPGARVTFVDVLARIEVHTDERGRFSVGQLLPGASYNVTIAGPGAAPTTFYVQAPADRDFELEPATSVRVDVSLDSRLARCVRAPWEVELTVIAPGAADVERRETLVAAPTGQSVVSDLPPGAHAVTAYLGTTFATERVETEPGRTSDVSLVLHPVPGRSLLDVTFIDPGGMPAYGYLDLVGPTNGAIVVTDEAGHGCVMLEPGTYRVTSAWGRAELSVRAGEEGTRRVQLDPLPVRAPVDEEDEDEAEDLCDVPLVAGRLGDELWVEYVLPGSPLEVGDRIIRVGDETELGAMIHELFGPRGTSILVIALRPDGTRFSAIVERSECD